MNALAWGAKVSPEFRDKARAIAARIGTEPSSLMACIAFETGRTFSPKARNPGSSGTGLIQFMRDTARSLGTSIEALAKMTAEEQLSFVYDYLRPFTGRVSELGDLYMAILYPPAVGKPDDFAVFENASKAYQANAGLDFNHDGVITKRECVSIVEKVLAEGLQFGNRWFEPQPDVPTIPLNEVTPAEGRTPPQPADESSKETTMPVPFLMLASALGPLIGEMIPAVAKAFDKKAETPQKVEAATKIVETIVKATNATNVQEAVEKMQSDPAIKKIASDAVLTNPQISGLLEIGGGVEAARKANADPTAPPFWRQGAFVVAVILTPLIYMTVFRVLWGDGYSEQLRTVVVTAILSGLLGALTGYFFGSMYSTTSGNNARRATDEVKA